MLGTRRQIFRVGIVTIQHYIDRIVIYLKIYLRYAVNIGTIMHPAEQRLLLAHPALPMMLHGPTISLFSNSAFGIK